MAARVTQQLIHVAYATTPEVRATSLKLEVIRTDAATPSAPSVSQSLVFIICS